MAHHNVPQNVTTPYTEAEPSILHLQEEEEDTEEDQPEEEEEEYTLDRVALAVKKQKQSITQETLKQEKS
jgi:hypothetical protein